MQNGAQMTDTSGAVTFVKETAKDYTPGIEAIKFYLDFASPTKSVYTWNSKMPNSFDAFCAAFHADSAVLISLLNI